MIDNYYSTRLPPYQGFLWNPWDRSRQLVRLNKIPVMRLNPSYIECNYNKKELLDKD